MKVWVNGTFDILHVGHLKLLDYASQLGTLIVGIDTDERVKKLKGNGRPFNNQNDRKIMLESLKFVHQVVFFNSDEELTKIIHEYSPDVMVIGDDYKDKNIVGSNHVKQIIYFEKSSKSFKKKCNMGFCNDIIGLSMVFF
jgi:D-beta-D-heptose 7-phosphate kinase/D-beta-D-heptose 1-phosphate adenosyltransferase